MGLQYFAGEPSASLLARKANASSSVISAPGEVFQCAASIISIAAGVPLRRPSLPFVPRGESRDLAYLDRSGRSRDRREHQFPLQSEAFDRPCDETGRRSRAIRDRKRVVSGKSGSVRVALGGGRLCQKTTRNTIT